MLHTRALCAALLLLLGLLAGPAWAERLSKGQSLVFVGIGGHTGEFILQAFSSESGEVGGHLAYQRFLSDQWTLGISGAYHGNRRSTVYQNNPSLGTWTIGTHSFTVRVGGDRYAFIDDNVALYAGAGLLLTRGRAKYEQQPASGGGLTIEGPNTTELGLNGRIGMYTRLGNGTGLFGHIGQVLSRTSGKDATGKLSWWSSTHEGSVGLALDF